MKLYLDTSVYGGYYDEEFMEATRALFAFINHHKIEVITSKIVMQELKPARKQVQEVIHLLHDIELINITKAVKQLAQKYVQLNVVGPGSIADATHIAMATLRGATTLVSWNMKHMVSRQNAFNSVNLQSGYKNISIDTPTKVLKTYNYHG